jgi:hypothetical protein
MVNPDRNSTKTHVCHQPLQGRQQSFLTIKPAGMARCDTT